MLALRAVCLRRAAHFVTVAPGGLVLGGCVSSPVDGPAWLFFGLALGIVALLAHALGAARTRLLYQARLRESRDEAQRHRQLLNETEWASDADHHIKLWRSPGSTSGGGVTDGPGLVPMGHGLDQRLKDALSSQQAFSGLRLGATAEQALAWEWRGVPRFDAEGRFDGFDGRACRVEDTQRLHSAAAAVPALLAAHGAPALWVSLCDGIWRIELLNAEARGLWPVATVGDALEALATPVPAPVMQALEMLKRQTSTTPVEAADWVLALSQAPDSTRCAVLMQRPAGGQGSQDGEDLGFTVSHDLRAPIRVVEGFARIVKEDYGPQLDRVANDHLDRVLAAAARMNLMIDALLTLARLSRQPLSRQPVDLSMVAGFVADELRRAEPERQVEITIDPGLSALGDPTLLRMVLENLLGNAWKYSARAPHAEITFCAIERQGRRAFVVRDNGAGFDMRSAERLFGLFQRLHGASEFAGHGVGLASVQRIVHRHGGEVWAEAEPGRGAAFYFTLAS